MLSKKFEYRIYRILEIIPGAMVWVTFLLALGLSFINPLFVIAFIIVFDALWLARISYLLIYLLAAYFKFRKESKKDWLSLAQAQNGFGDLMHLIFLPTYKEPEVVIDQTLESLTKIQYPAKKLFVVLCGEEKDKENFLNIAGKMESKYQDAFFKLLVTLHPQDVPGEVAGKGANTAYAGKIAKGIIDELQIAYEKIVVSSFDVDTVVHPQYFACLAYHYLTVPKPTRTSYQPLALYNNNVWQSPFLMRVVSMSTTFWLLTEQMRPERLFTFSSHSMSFKALVDVGFWQSDIVTEDSRICVQGIIEYDGDYRVQPMFIPLSMDTVMGQNLKSSLSNQYKQVRRWAYGVENFPFMAWNFWGNKNIKFLKKFRYIYNQLEGIYSWATAPILIFVLGRLPIAIANHRGLNSAIIQNTPHILSILMTVSMIGLLASAFISLTLLPPKPTIVPRWHWVIMFAQWIFFPITMIIFGSIPATDAVTRLMLGKYLGFQVTEKFRKKN
ncbi:MAG: glycosyltransferase family 2 protein [Patescibacteria group bacterium]|jgi:cellulose synthase/poly-beta-1,6-N-acetylglucosamine synthase-like glycosyltransferase